MKKYILIIGVLLAVLSCEVDDYDKLSDITKPQIFTPSLFNITETSIGNAIPISINDFSSISDASQGVVSRTWLIEEGAHFLTSEFTRKDSLNLVSFIDPDLNLTNWQEVAHVLFQKEGETKVILKNRFDKEVSFLGTNSVLNANGLWELTTTLTYDVYADLNTEATVTNVDETETYSTLTANMNPSLDNTTGFDVITIEAGSSLTFTDQTTIGRPSGRTWAFEGGTPEVSEEAKTVVAYNRLGEYTTTLTSIREKRGSNLNATEQTKVLPVIVKVIPSSQPYVILDNATALNDNNEAPGTNIISFATNGEIDTFSGAESDFTVHVTNTSFDENFTVTSAKTSSSDGTIIELTLDQPILNSDTVTLSYSGTEIKSIDSRTLEAFTDVPVNALNLNLLTNASNPGFENASDNERHAKAQGFTLFVGGGNSLDNAKNDDGSLFAERSTEMASEGVASLKFNAVLPYETGIGFLSLSNTLLSNSAIPSGDYKVTFDVFIEDGSDYNAVFNVIQQGTPRTQLVPFNAPSTGQWFTVEREFSNANTLAGNLIFNFRDQDNSGITGRQVFYLDNIKIISLEAR